MNLISENNRNDVYCDGDVIRKFYRNKNECDRELHALTILKESKVDFIYPILRTEDIKKKDGLYFLEFDFIDNIESNNDISASALIKDSNIKRLSEIIIQIHSLPFYKKSADIVGMIDKAIVEGGCVCDSRSVPFLQIVKDRYSVVVSDMLENNRYCFVHGDIFPENMIFDENGNVLGLFDFGHSGGGLVESDLRQLPCFIGDRMNPLIKEYEKKTNKTINLQLLTYLAVCRFLELSFNYQNVIKDFDKYKNLESNFHSFFDKYKNFL